jgi:hypothetical protein
MSRDRDVRNAIQMVLAATRAFDVLPDGGYAVYVWGPPDEKGTGSSQQAAAWVVPMSSCQEDLWDASPSGGLVITSRVAIILAYRNEDAQLRDEGVELLLDTATNALNGQSLASFTLPQTTRIIQWEWQKPTAPERQINAILSYQYIVDPTWDSYDTTP